MVRGHGEAEQYKVNQVSPGTHFHEDELVQAALLTSGRLPLLSDYSIFTIHISL